MKTIIHGEGALSEYHFVDAMAKDSTLKLLYNGIGVLSMALVDKNGDSVIHPGFVFKDSDIDQLAVILRLIRQSREASMEVK